MATRRRELNPKRKPRVPTTPVEWDRLAKRVIAHLQKQGDTRRVAGIKKLIETGKVEKNFRKLGVVCEADIQREFKSKS